MTILLFYLFWALDCGLAEFVWPEMVLLKQILKQVYNMTYLYLESFNHNESSLS